MKRACLSNDSVPFIARRISINSVFAAHRKAGNPSIANTRVNSNPDMRNGLFANASRVDAIHPELGWIVTIRNDSGVALPSTGGPGTRLFTLLGIMLIALTGILLWRRQRCI